MRFLLLIAICTDLRGSQEVLCGRENLPVAFVVSLYNGFLLAVLTPVHLVNEDLCGSAELLLVVGFEFLDQCAVSFHRLPSGGAFHDLSLNMAPG